jgi:hypothetical protein
VPIPGPALSAVLHGDKLLVSWPLAGANDYDLQTATNLSGIVTWQNVTNGIYPLGTNYYATNDISGPFQLFRLRSRQ